MWVSKVCEVTRRYSAQPSASTRDMVRDGKHWLVTDIKAECVHMVTPEGKQARHLVTKEQNLWAPTHISIAKSRTCVCREPEETL